MDKKFDKDKLKCKKNAALKSLREVECFLNSFCKVNKGKKIFNWMKKCD